MRRKKIEFSRSEMIAVRLVDAINLELVNLVPSFIPIWWGFRLEITREEVNNSTYRKLIIKPAGWPKDSVISCLLFPKDGFYALDGEINTSHLGNFQFFGCDHGGGVGEKPRADMVWVTIYPST